MIRLIAMIGVPFPAAQSEPYRPVFTDFRKNLFALLERRSAAPRIRRFD